MARDVLLKPEIHIIMCKLCLNQGDLLTLLKLQKSELLFGNVLLYLTEAPHKVGALQWIREFNLPY